MIPNSAALDHLNSLDVKYTLHVPEKRPRSLEDAAAQRGLQPGQIVRTLIFRMTGGKFLAVLMPGPTPVSWGKLRRYLGVTRITTARSAEVEDVSGYQPGQVSPFGLPVGLRLLADRSIAVRETVSVGAGIPGAGVTLASADLLAALQPELVDLRPPTNDPHPGQTS